MYGKQNQYVGLLKYYSLILRKLTYNKEFTYLGQTLTEDAQIKIDIRRKVMAKKTFKEKYILLATKNTNLELRNTFL